MDRIVGRDEEVNKLLSYYKSDKEEFIALYGRIRVGKTFLISRFFKDKFDFYATGIIGGTPDVEMKAFHDALLRYGHKETKKPSSWLDAFQRLAELLEAKKKNNKKRLVVFIDELPCFDTPRSGFLSSLDYFWNSRASWIRNIFFVVCGSATSWMLHNIVNNKEGLHRRITHTMHLRPFTLKQTEDYLKSRKFRWSKFSILQIYMILGGVPYYLSLLDANKNVPDNIDSLFFSLEAELDGEFQRLFSSLFHNALSYMNIVKLLSTHMKGYTRNEIADKLGIHNNGHLSSMLEDLEHCDFIRRYNNARLQKNGIFQMVDFFTLFHYKFCTRRITDEHFWRNNLGKWGQNSWYGLTFEKVCLLHIRQIINGLHLDSISHEYYAWRSQNSNQKVQIDLIIDRADGIVTLCEIKYSKDDYTLSEKEYKNIIRRMEAFQEETNHKGGIQVSIITTFSLKSNMYTEISPIPITMTELFS